MNFDNNEIKNVDEKTSNKEGINLIKVIIYLMILLFLYLIIFNLHRFLGLSAS